ncbi:MAG: glycoside hydrolase family 16 protein [Muribaculaceae bacterium]|nr:glycoside hydrolase family 16 protein [Muribaculaceae bacterium]
MEQWTAEIGFQRNNEDQWYTDSNFELRDGKLVIIAKKERFKNPNYKRFGKDWKETREYVDYTSASLKTKAKFHYGIYEMRAKIPVGTGYWPAYWACGNSREWPNNGEIDMLEYYGDAIHANVAWGSSTRWNATWSSQAPRMSNFDSDFADKYHDWRMEFDYESIRLYMDDRLLNETKLDRTVNPKVDWLPGDDGYNPYRDENNLFDAAWVNLALGGNNGGSLTNTPFPAEYLIEYVRVYTPDGIYSGINWYLAKAQEALDSTTEGNEPGEYTTAAREALTDAMEAAKAQIDVADEAGAKAAADALRAAIETYKTSYNPAVAGEYFFEHVASNLRLSTGWKDNEHCVLILTDNRLEGADSKGYQQAFTLVEAPEGAAVKGFNLKVGDNDYVYRNSWNLRVSSSPNLTAKDYIFNIEFDGKYARIKNEGSGKYFGTDDNWGWANVYSDKAGVGNAKSAFRMIRTDLDGVQDITVDAATGISAVYNMQGIRVADSLEGLAGNAQMYIVVENGKSRKVLIR